jgi:hypothetical protein
MSNNNNTKATTFWNFLNDNTIEIPIIQRDYAQGRLGKENLRKNFLADLKKALDNEIPYKDAAMKLDFVYGSTESGILNPLDGQQRLTTLWLLHWYIALSAGKLSDDNCKVFRKFTYETRISSREFCQRLCVPKNFEDFDGNDIVGFITKQTWFYSAWKQDPTIQSMLRMLGGTKTTDKKGEDIVDGIEELFKNTNKDFFKDYWQTLTEKETIVFYHLPLSDFGLSDDLYIKMNARGKQLTSFENFKADLIGYITKQSEDETLEKIIRAEWEKLLDPKGGIPIKLDTDWTDIFWSNRSKGIRDKEGKTNKSNQIDEIYFAFLNRFFWNELFVAKKSESPDEYVLDIGKGDENSTQENENVSYRYLNDSNNRNSNDYDTRIAYQEFDVYKYYNGIPIGFFVKLQNVLNNFYNYCEKNTLPQCPWYGDFSFIPQYALENSNNIIITNNSNEKILKVSTLNQVERIAYFAICQYFDHNDTLEDNETTLAQWMRVVWNLISGADQNGRPQIRSTRAMRTAMEFLGMLDSHNVYECLKNYNTDLLSNSDFDERCKEEIAKAKQILNENGDLRKYKGSCKKENGADYQTWEEIIIEAEQSMFFNGGIRFLYTGHDGKVQWCCFDDKWNNIKSLIPSEKGNRHTIRLMIPYFSDDDIKDVFRKRNLSNDDNNLRMLLWTFPSKVHSFLMVQDKTSELSLLQNDLISLCEKHPSFWIHIMWEENMDILSNYEKRSGYYEYESYVVGSDFFKQRLELLKTVENIGIRENGTEVWKGLFIEFKYRKHIFRWQLNDWIDMYDNHMNNLWKKNLHSQYNGRGESSFTDAQSLITELERCCNEFEDLYH